jgi:nucleotide sugar dehydrogenase
MVKIAVIGTGYVGLVSGACLADFGNHVICADIDASKIEKLQKGEIPIYEPGLEDVVERNIKASRLSFTINIKEAVSVSDVVFIAVGTPPAEDGSADLSHVLKAADDVASAMEHYTVVVDKSTVPVGTARLVKGRIDEKLEALARSIDFDMVSNPEFLREGSAVQDFMRPDRVVFGAESERAFAIMEQVYRALYLNETPFIETSLETAEMIKYASNAFLAVKITYINEIGKSVRKGWRKCTGCSTGHGQRWPDRTEIFTSRARLRRELLSEGHQSLSRYWPKIRHSSFVSRDNHRGKREAEA